LGTSHDEQNRRKHGKFVEQGTKVIEAPSARHLCRTATTKRFLAPEERSLFVTMDRTNEN
jgi:hypothetical protein